MCSLAPTARSTRLRLSLGSAHSCSPPHHGAGDHSHSLRWRGPTGSTARAHGVGEGRRKLLLKRLAHFPSHTSWVLPTTTVSVFFINKWKASAWVGGSSSLQTDSTQRLALSPPLYAHHRTPWGQHWPPKGWCPLPYMVCLLRHVGTK